MIPAAITNMVSITNQEDQFSVIERNNKNINVVLWKSLAAQKLRKDFLSGRNAKFIIQKLKVKKREKKASKNPSNVDRKMSFPGLIQNLRVEKNCILAIKLAKYYRNENYIWKIPKYKRPISINVSRNFFENKDLIMPF